MPVVRYRPSQLSTSISLLWGKHGGALSQRVGSESLLDSIGAGMEWQIRRLSFSDVKKQLHPVDLKALPSEHAQVTWPKLKGNFKLSPSEIPDQLHQTDHTFDAVFLRDSCSCERCVDPSTTQKTFDSADIPRNTRPKSLESQNDGTVRIVWEPEVPGFEGHVSMYGPSFGCMNRSLQSRLAATSNILDGSTLWDSRCMSEHHLTVDYTDYMSSSSILLSSLRHLFRFGLLFLRAVPSNTDAVSHIAKRIGPVKETLYGSTWDVRSVPSAKNVAYTSSHLGFHMDLLYVDNPPGLQILHCLKSSTKGGESLFSDTLRAVSMIQRTRMDHYLALKTFPVTYHYHNNHEWYQQTRPHIETTASPHEIAWPTNPEKLTMEPSIKAINWSPPFQAPFLSNVGNRPPPILEPTKDDSLMHRVEEHQSREFCEYFDAIRHFKGLMEADEAVFEQKLKPGTAVIFNNRRIVHARRAFENQGGERWLRGAYVDTDAFRSRLRILKEEMS